MMGYKYAASWQHTGNRFATYWLSVPSPGPTAPKLTAMTGYKYAAGWQHTGNRFATYWLSVPSPGPTAPQLTAMMAHNYAVGWQQIQPADSAWSATRHTPPNAPG